MSPVDEPPDPSGATIRVKFRPSRALMASVKGATAPPPRPRLALAHWIERAVESGQVASYGEVARALGVSESRVTQIMALLGLSPALQERVLVGEGGLGIRAAMRAARGAEWEAQNKAAENVKRAPRRTARRVSVWTVEMPLN